MILYIFINILTKESLYSTQKDQTNNSLIAKDQTNFPKLSRPIINSKNSCGPDLIYTIETSNLIINGTGEMSDFDYEGTTWFNEREQITNIYIQDWSQKLDYMHLVI